MENCAISYARGENLEEKVQKSAKKVIICMEDVIKEAEEKVIPIEVDVTNTESIKMAFNEIATLTDKLFAIIHFAGVYTLDSLVEITDEELLEQTGGIVQGMSGSPIIQDGKLIGAVTHVFVNDATKGYGVYIDWMMEEINNT